jgi:predicted metal-dependent peptidase
MSQLRQAEDKITKAKAHMIARYPFYAIIAFKMDFRNAEEDGMWMVRTMGTDGRHCWWNTDFVISLTLDELIGVIAHEVLHVAMMHMLRRGMRDPIIWNVAADAVINPILLDSGLKLPSDRIFIEKYQGWTAERAYDDLAKSQPDLPKKFSVPMPGSDKPGQGKPSQSNGNGKADQPGKGDGQGDQDDDGEPGEGKPLWGTFMEPRNDDGEAMSEADKSTLENEIKITVVQAAEAAKAIGKLPGALHGLIKAVGTPSVNWKDYILSFVKGAVPDNYTWTRPNRSIMANYGIYAPRMENRGCGNGVLSIDVSASVSDAELVTDVTEIVGLIEQLNPDRLWIIQHDAIVQKVEEWEAGEDFKELKVAGRGGTNIQPVFRKVEKMDEQIDWMICFTDFAINDFPPAKDAPDYPVLWACTGPDRGEAKFGTYLALKHPLEMKL